MKHPVVIFAFRRPEHTARVMQAIREYQPNKLYLVADGPRQGRPGEAELCLQTRQVLDGIDWECEVVREYAETNLGLKERVSSGLDLVFANEASAIILEDDCLPAPDFFRFCEYALEKYANEERIALVSGNNFNPLQKDSDGYFFHTHANIWGWATWGRTWRRFRSSGYLNEIPEGEISVLLSSIEPQGVRKSFSRLVGALGKLNSWAIPFAAFIYSRKLLCVTPGANLVTNVGMGSDSTHTKFESYVDEVPVGSLKWPLMSPTRIEPDLEKINRESKHRATKWITYPLLHPLDFAGRVIRYFFNIFSLP